MILLTGATGFLGSKLLETLICKQHGVICMKRSTSDLSRVRKLITQCKWIDIDKEGIETVFQKYYIETIIHCATSYGRKPEDYFEVYKGNVDFPITILECAIQHGSRYFINTDSFFVKIIDSLWKKNGRLYMDAYVKSKYIFTNIVKDYVEEMNLAFINLQLEHIYGADNGTEKFVDWLVRNLLQNVPAIELTEGKQLRDWIYIEDVVSAYLTILEKRAIFQAGRFYQFEVGTGKATSLREFVELAKELAHSTTKLDFGKRQLNRNELEKSCADNSELCKLGWEPSYNIASGLAQILER